MAQWGKLSFAQKNCLSAVGKLMQKSGQIAPGARVGVAVSGGVDSFTMLQVLRYRQRIVPFDFELMVLHVNPGFAPDSHRPLADWVTAHGLSAHFELTNFGLDAHSEVNRKNSPCFYCAWNRRKRFFELCRRYGLTHLALGHTAQDLVTTFFMNIFQGGKVQGLSGKEPFFGGELTLIRPMLLLDKPMIVRAAKAWGLPIWENVCPSAKDSRRDDTYQWLAARWQEHKKMKNAVYNAVLRWQLDLGL
jgi:tRNA(Ile)-lysidine synthase TilS/MesJ